ncbi:MAG: OmpA family protein [Pirellulaceae bacterium]|nr:OmpA family protein [Pirellulaceae bacterium]
MDMLAEQKPRWARHLCWVSLLAGTALVSGCNRPGYNPYMPPGAAGYPYPAPTAGMPAGPGSVYAGGQMAPQLIELQRRSQELDANNRQLTMQLAQIQQQATAYRERADLLARQLEDANRQNSQLLATAQQYADHVRGMQASMTSRGGARLTANNSLSTTAPSGMDIPGARVLPEGQFIRVRVATDQMFAPGTAQLNPIAASTLDQFAALLARQYPRQRVAVELHTDAGGANGLPFTQQSSTAQAQAVVDYLIQRHGLPVQQLYVIGHGPSRPIADNSTPSGRAENRRLELVVTPETF